MPSDKPMAGRLEAERALAFVREKIGENVTATLRWARSGKDEFPIIGGQSDWSLEAICGKYGKFEVSAPGCRLPVDRASFEYDIAGNKIGLTTRIEYELQSSKAPMAGAQPVGFGPMSLLTVFSVLRSLWAIFNTRVSLMIGGNVECTAVLSGDTLGIQFSKDCPYIAIESIFDAHLKLNRLEITGTKATAFMNKKGWFSSKTIKRTFELN